MGISNQTYAVPVGPPIAISAYGINVPLTIINTGDVTIYLTPDQDNNSGLAVTAGANISWESSSPLFAYAVDGPGSMQVVQARVSGQTSVDISGPVDIDSIASPVLIQSAGDILLATGSFTVDGTSGATLTIPEPANGLSYPSIRISYVVQPSPPNRGNMTIAFDGVTADEIAYGEIGNSSDAVGEIYREDFWLPFDGNYPITIELDPSNGGIDRTANFTVYGTSLEITKPQTNNVDSFKTERAFATAAVNTDFAIDLPPSHEPYRIKMYTGGTVTQSRIVTYNIDAAATVNVNFYDMIAPRYGNIYEATVANGGNRCQLILRLSTASNVYIWAEPF